VLILSKLYIKIFVQFWKIPIDALLKVRTLNNILYAYVAYVCICNPHSHKCLKPSFNTSLITLLNCKVMKASDRYSCCFDIIRKYYLKIFHVLWKRVDTQHFGPKYNGNCVPLSSQFHASARFLLLALENSIKYTWMIFCCYALKDFFKLN
jgi:hypothetical protein